MKRRYCSYAYISVLEIKKQQLQNHGSYGISISLQEFPLRCDVVSLRVLMKH